MPHFVRSCRKNQDAVKASAFEKNTESQLILRFRMRVRFCFMLRLFPADDLQEPVFSAQYRRLGVLAPYP